MARPRGTLAPRARDGSRAVRAAAIVHASHEERLAGVLERLAAVEPPLDLIVTTHTGQREAIDGVLRSRGETAQLLSLDGEGVLPFLDALAADETAGYDVLFRVAAGATEDGDVLDDLLDPDLAGEIVQAFASQPQLGLLGATSDRARFADVPGDHELVRAIAHRLGIVLEPSRDTFFASGTVFVRPAALAPLRALELSRRELAEHGPLGEAVTRCLGLSALAAGLRAEDTRTFRRVRSETAAGTA